MKKKWRRKGSHSSSISGSNHLVRLQTCRKRMGWCTAQWKMLLFCVKTIVKVSRKFEVACLKKEKKKELAIWWISGLVCLWCALAPLGVLFHENTPRQIAGCYNGLQVSCFWDFERFIYASALSLHIESTMVTGFFFDFLTNWFSLHKWVISKTSRAFKHSIVFKCSPGSHSHCSVGIMNCCSLLEFPPGLGRLCCHNFGNNRYPTTLSIKWE